VRASLDSTLAAPATWTGTADLSGDALLEFASGGITAIASGADLSLGGALSLVALSTALTTDSALTALATNAGTLSLSDSALTTTVALNNTGTFEVDYSYYGTAGGGSAVAIGGTLTNSGFVEIGNTGITKATTVTAKGLANTGTIDLTGGAAIRATLDSTAAAPATWIGSAFLSGDAVLEFASGGITAIGGGADLSLNGALSWVALSTAVTGNSALTKLASNGGTFVADGGAGLTTAGLTNTGTIDIDTIGTGGSHLTVGGALTNQGYIEIGNSGITKAATLSATGLANSGTIYLTGGTAQADLSITGAATNTNFIDLTDSLLSTTTGFTNSGSVEINLFGGSGGSTVKVGGTLTNNYGGVFDIGNTAITKATTVTAAGLSNYRRDRVDRCHDDPDHVGHHRGSPGNMDRDRQSLRRRVAGIRQRRHHRDRQRRGAFPERRRGAGDVRHRADHQQRPDRARQQWRHVQPRKRRLTNDHGWIYQQQFPRGRQFWHRWQHPDDRRGAHQWL
jgi:hypothetical protein